MAALARPDMISSRSRSVSSSKSFSSWSSRRRPRDSLERVREGARELPPAQLSLIRDLSIPELSVQQVGRGEGLLVEGEQEAEMQSVPLDLPHHTISCSAVCERYPKGKASVLLFVLNFIVSYAFGAAITGILNIFQTEKNLNRNINTPEKHVLNFVSLLFQFCISRMFYPVAGFVADVYIGRCKTVKISLVLLSVGYLLLVGAFTLGGQSKVVSSSRAGIMMFSIRVIAFLVISAGGGAFEATSIPFGVDQLQGASSNEISSYFHFFYFSRNLGMVVGIGIYSTVLYGSLKMNSNEFHHYLEIIRNDPQINELYSVFQPLVTLMILVAGLILLICCHQWFFNNTLWENPVKLIAKVLCYTATVKRHLPVRNRAFRYGEERKKRIELAKVTYDGKFPDEKVEDVKAFCRIFFIIISLFPTMFCINAFNTILAYETNATLTELHPHKFLQIDLYPSIYFGVNSALILFILPVVNFLVIPCFPKLTIRARIGIGLVLYCIGSLMVVAIHAVPLASYTESSVSDVQLGCLLIPMVTFALAEVLTAVSVLEFIYAQSPESMKGLLTGLFFFILGLSSVFSSGINYLYSHTLENRKLIPFHGAFALIQIVGVVLYGMVAVLHKNRMRPDGESSSRHQQRMMIEDQLHISMIGNR